MISSSATASFEDNHDLTEACSRIDLARSGVGLLHIGPLDYNVASVIDGLLAAVSLLERFRDEQLQSAARAA